MKSTRKELKKNKIKRWKLTIVTDCTTVLQFKSLIDY